MLALEKVRTSNLKVEAIHKVKDQTETIKQQAETIKARSEEVHAERNRANVAELKNAATAARFEQVEKRLEDCEADRAQMWAALNAHGITRISPNVPPT